MIDFEKVCVVTDILPGTVMRVSINGTPVAIYNVEGTFYATADRCTHARASLSGGFLNGFLIECPMHQGSFDIRTGQAVAPPCKRPLRLYSVSIRGEDVCLSEVAASNA